MEQAAVLAGRVAAAARRVVGSPEQSLVGVGVLCLVAMAEMVLYTDQSRTDTTTGVLLGLCATAPLAFARTHVAVAAVAITATTFIGLATDFGVTTAGIVAQVMVLYLLGRHPSVRLTVVIGLAFLVYAVTAPFDQTRGARLFGLLLLALTAGALAVGTIQRLRGEAAWRDQSRQEAQDTLVEYAARGERARIARELHDVVAHHISVIAVQAEAARLATAGMPDEGARRLTAIGDTARSALTEMRRLLGVLREDAGEELTRAPQPGLRQLNELVDEARTSAGASTRLIVRGQVVALDPGVQLTAYRIVQEALTNARRHAPGAATDVELDYGDDALRVRVRDNGPGPAEGMTSGHGLVGMRERAAMVGGDLHTGSTPSGGFLVEAVLPTTGVAG